MDLGISGRWAVVCASSKGLGYGCAISLAQEGVNLVMNARSSEVLEQAADQIRKQTGVEVRTVAADIAAIPDVSYVVIVSGSFDLLMEVVCEDDDHLLTILNDKVRAIPGVRSTETFTYLRLDKQTFAWGTR